MDGKDSPSSAGASTPTLLATLRRLSRIPDLLEAPSGLWSRSLCGGTPSIFFTTEIVSVAFCGKKLW